MSYYYNYYAGYIKDGKIYPLGPFDNNGNMHSIISRSRSFASDLHYDFENIKQSEISEQLHDTFAYKGDSFNDILSLPNIKILPFNELPSQNFIKKGYVLIEQIQAYENDPDDFDGFYDVISPQIYAAKLEKEIKFGKNPIQTDEFGNEFHEPNASEYMFYMWPDYNSKEYEAFIIRQFFDSLSDYDFKDSELVVLETEG